MSLLDRLVEEGKAEYAKECQDCVGLAIAFYEAGGNTVEWGGEFWYITDEEGGYVEATDADLIEDARNQGVSFERCETCKARAGTAEKGSGDG